MRLLTTALLTALLAAALSGCGAMGTLTDGLKHAQEVANDLERSVGSKPQVGFNWSNGVLARVSVTFDRVPAGRSAEQIAALVQSSVGTRFEQKPRHLILGFDLATE